MLHCKIFGQVKLKKRDGKGYTCKVALEVNSYSHSMNMIWKWFNYLIAKYYIYIYVHACPLELWNKVTPISNSYRWKKGR